MVQNETRNLKRCQQCGEIRPIDEFRQYYNRNKTKEPGRYRTCKQCEALNQRYKYLTSKFNKNAITEEESAEREQIEQIYDMLREAGLKPPGYTSLQSPKESITHNMLEVAMKRRAEAMADAERQDEDETPPELLEWLDKDLDSYKPEYLLETVYEDLKERYMPAVGTNPDLSERRDERYRNILNRILERFYDYEDTYWDEH